MKKVSIWGVLASAFVLAACNNDVVPETTKTEFKIVSSISPLTRTPNLDESGAGHFLLGDENTLFFHTSDKGLLHTLNYTYGSTYYWYDLNLGDVKSCTISACYPPVETETPQNFHWDIRQQRAQSDFLMAAPVDAYVNSSGPINLVFKHVLHKLVVELVADNESVSDEEIQQAVISCTNLQPVAVLNLLNGTVVNATEKLATLDAEAGKKAAFILPSQEVKDMSISVQIQDKSYQFKLADCIIRGEKLGRLESGQSLFLKFTVSKDSFTITDQEILGWESQGEYEGSIRL